MAMQETTAAYRNVLKDLSCDFKVVDGIEQILRPSRAHKSRRQAFVLEDAPVALLTKASLKAHTPDLNGNYPVLLYHPVYETAGGKESPILAHTRMWARTILNAKMEACLLGVGGYVVDKAEQDKLKTPQLKYIRGLGEKIKPAAFDFLQRLIKKANPNQATRTVLQITRLRNQSKVNGEAVEAVYALRSPLLNELLDAADGKTETVWDIKIPKTHVKGIIALFNRVLPELTGKVYDQSSTSKVAPKFEAMIRTYVEASKPLDKIFGLFPELDKLREEELKMNIVDGTWVDDMMDDLAGHRAAAPQTLGNMSDTAVAREKAKAAAQQAVAPAQPAPTAQPATGGATLIGGTPANTGAGIPIGQQQAQPDTIVVNGVTYHAQPAAAQAQQNVLIGNTPAPVSQPLIGGNTQAAGTLIGAAPTSGGVLISHAPQPGLVGMSVGTASMAPPSVNTYIDAQGQQRSSVVPTFSR